MTRLADQKGEYPKKVIQILEGYRRTDPAVQPQIAVTVTVVKWIRIPRAQDSPRDQEIDDLCIITFYYLLRVGEYTWHRPSDNRRTQQFRVKDVTFWKKFQLLPHTLSKKELIEQFTAATLHISIQKNGVRAQAIHHEALKFNHNCPIKYLI